MNTPKFSRSLNADFSKVLKSRIRKYFKDENKDKHANTSMILKTVLMLSLFLAPLIIISSGIVGSVTLLFSLYIVSGLGMAGIGMGVMHDAIHSSYSKNKWVNKILAYSMNLIGANSTVWKIQHNVLHHSYTNIHEADDDINMPFFLRFSPHDKKYTFHRFQFIYVWIFYSLSTISWITAKDFLRLFRYRNLGFIKKNNEFRKEFIKLSIWKLLYYVIALLLPILALPFAPWIIVLAFVTMHLITGLLISCVFQVAHIMPSMEYDRVNEQKEIQRNWETHQLMTTTNFSPGSRIFSWLIGGLNYQIEHHLFPNICHVHYRKISPIVKRTTEEFGIPYHSKKTFISAIADHISMLRYLGKVKVPAQKVNC